MSGTRTFGSESHPFKAAVIPLVADTVSLVFEDRDDTVVGFFTPDELRDLGNWLIERAEQAS